MRTQPRRLFKSAMALGVASLVFLTPMTCQGWGAGGHMIVAYIAYNKAGLNPRAKAQIDKLLAIPIDPAMVSRKSKDFVNAAHWADDVRPDPNFDEYKQLHFIDTPFSEDGTTLPNVPTPNIVTALQDQIAILQTSTDDKERAKALRLIIHFVGDIHQPLHCATRVDSAHPDGDRGGNLASIQIPSKTGKMVRTNLHSYWDGGIGSFPKTGPDFSPPPLSQIPAAAQKAMNGNPITDLRGRSKDPFSFQLWADESFDQATSVAYKGITNSKKPTATYNRVALKVVNRRVSWAGYRLAALLNAIWP